MQQGNIWTSRKNSSEIGSLVRPAELRDGLTGIDREMRTPNIGKVRCMVGRLLKIPTELNIPGESAQSFLTGALCPRKCWRDYRSLLSNFKISLQDKEKKYHKVSLNFYKTQKYIWKKYNSPTNNNSGWWAVTFIDARTYNHVSNGADTFSPRALSPGIVKVSEIPLSNPFFNSERQYPRYRPSHNNVPEPSKMQCCAHCKGHFCM